MIRRLETGDWDAWLPLWDGYLRFYREELAEEVTRRRSSGCASAGTGCSG